MLIVLIVGVKYWVQFWAMSDLRNAKLLFIVDGIGYFLATAPEEPSKIHFVKPIMLILFNHGKVFMHCMKKKSNIERS